MSLIIATVTPFGIVAAADTRTTTRAGSDVQYSDDTQKIYPSGKNAVILTCGQNKIGENMLVHDFLAKFNKEYDFDEVKKIAFQLLCDTLCVDKEADVSYIVAGYDDERNSTVYRVNTGTLEVSMCLDTEEYGSVYNGITDISKAILDGCDFSNMTIKNAIELTTCAMRATSISSKYHNLQGVGPLIDTYIIGKDNSDKKTTGWISYNHGLRNASKSAQAMVTAEDEAEKAKIAS